MTSVPDPWTGPPWGSGRQTWIVVPAALLGLVTIVACAGISTRQPFGRPFDALAVALLLLAPASLVLVVRRGVLGVLGACLGLVGPVTYVALGYVPGPAFVPLGFTVVALGVTRQRILSLAAGTAGALAAVVLATGPGARPVAWATVTVAGLAVAMLLGEGARGRAERMRALRAARASREESAVAAERLRIARELHDVLAHSLSGITVQAGVGLHLMDREPEAARRALTEIREASKDALDEVREVLGVLRADGEAPREPAGGAGPRGLADLLVRARADGLRVDDSGVLDAAHGLPDPVAGVVHRTLQEALTNVRRHAPGAGVQARLVVGDRIVLEVVDDGPGGGSVSEGFGLRGMRERAEAVGGTLVAGPGPTGFRVRLELPRGER
ncbi:sensor histidine kinase [Cellulomonas fengjieae]|uniref:sensor histidine kinase n=1 Tax=Cellulomonas fengjieae TaxID=2819978 RepID=UPI001AAEADEC|nr:sensor histidine kinase [Cellulomonas fengjieae]MBO3101563.1 sensor histidine kinase [Cellulomonas fengjieae]